MIGGWPTCLCRFLDPHDPGPYSASTGIHRLLCADPALLGLDRANNSARSGQPGINSKEYGSLPVPVPPLPEQRAIAAVLSDADELIASLEALIAKKRDIKQAAMQQLLTGGTRLPGFGGEWKNRQLGELATMASGGTPLTSVPAYYDGDIPWVSISDMTNSGKVITNTARHLSHRGLANSAARLFPAYTVLYAAAYASLGECSIAGKVLCTSQAILGILPGQSLNSEFLYYYLTWIKKMVKELGQQGAQANLNKNMVLGYRLPNSLPSPNSKPSPPPYADMDDEIAALEHRLDKTRAIKQGMMQQLLTGSIRLPSPTTTRKTTHMTPEPHSVERKSSWRDEHLDCICGFANGRGGVLEIGGTTVAKWSESPISSVCSTKSPTGFSRSSGSSSTWI